MALASDMSCPQHGSMRARSLILAIAVTACGSESPVVVTDAAIGIYDKQSTGAATRSATCGGETIVDGVIHLQADRSFTKLDVLTTPSGSPFCGFLGGTWTRVDATTLELTPAVATLGPQQITVVGDDLTFPATNGALYRRHP